MVARWTGRRPALAVLCLALLWAAPAVAQIRIEASVDRNQITPRQIVNLTVRATVTGGGLMTVGNPEGDDFDVVGSFQDQSIEAAFGGDRTTVLVKRFQLRPRGEGTLVVGPVTLRMGHSIYQTDPIYIQVSASGDQAPPAGRPDTPEPPAPPPEPPSPNLPERVDPRQPFVTATPTDTTPYVGEQITVDYEVFAPVTGFWQVVSVRQPSFSSFWFEVVPPRNVTPYEPSVADAGGTRFRSDMAGRFVLVPLETGSHIIAPLGVEVADRFERRRIEIASEPTDIEVRPLPAGAPPGFSQNNVGQYEFSMAIESDGQRVGDTIRVVLRVEGYGLVNLVDLPQPEVTGGRLQPPLERREQRVSHGRVQGFKEIELAIIPSEEGELTIAPVEFHYFDPVEETYRTVRAEGRTFDISGFSPTADLVLGDESEAESELLLALAPARSTAGAAEGSSVPELPRPLWWSLVLLPPMIFAVSGVLGRWRRRRERFQPERVQKTAFVRARRALRGARELSAEAAYGAVATALRRYLRERLDIKAAALTRSETADALRRAGAEDRLAEEVSSLLETCEHARFSGVRGGESRIGAIVGRAVKAVKMLEKVR